MVDMSASMQADDCCYVDLGREISILHSLLQDSLKSMSANAVEVTYCKTSHFSPVHLNKTSGSKIYLKIKKSI